MRSTLPRQLYSAAQTRALDTRIIAGGVSGFELMRRAAGAVWEAIRERWPERHRLTVLCGGGNNGGDGYLVARFAHEAGWPVQVFTLVDRQRLTGDALTAREAAEEVGVHILPWRRDANLDGVLVDAMLGTGLNGDVREPYRGAIRAANASGLPLVAVDIPSGLDADRGVVLGDAIRADLTVTFIAAKFGLFTAEGPDQVGELFYAPLDEVPVESVPAMAERLDWSEWSGLLKSRPKAAHKGMFGHVLLVGGDHGMGGAIILAAEAALRSGAGRVSVATRPEHVASILTRCPEIMVHPAEDSEAIDDLLGRVDVVAIGPGLGRQAWGRSMLEKALGCGRPLVLDADALNEIAEAHPQAIELGRQCIITPHPAEAARLLGCTTSEVQADRHQAVTRLAKRYGCTAVLKGVGSLVAGPPDSGEPVALCSAGNPGMATAGMGDVLTGVAASLLARTSEAGTAARLAVLVHAMAGDAAAKEGEWGILASDLIRPVRQILNAEAHP
ncbi:NAD(P)H-hydrate epimerase [Halopseudomonas xinjiangensis]|uniref:Bifunctional NAD(P)H-hydrate repair enzyme n=1 Tax=Halopseudomonas xinjiangensis TaxID=487184 RepID=A0A1H1M529_9GAMM|nr:NAD(P)H-hydrate dehydratase [Halopseudomonas xinjiangensis]SDR81787.1 NAD(P)H-hydrate epimerase [Halopseudomonas xinjiangensis]